MWQDNKSNHGNKKRTKYSNTHTWCSHITHKSTAGTLACSSSVASRKRDDNTSLYRRRYTTFTSCVSLALRKCSATTPHLIVSYQTLNYFTYADLITSQILHALQDRPEACHVSATTTYNFASSVPIAEQSLQLVKQCRRFADPAVATKASFPCNFRPVNFKRTRDTQHLNRQGGATYLSAD